MTAASSLQKTANDHLIASETVFTSHFFIPYQRAIENALKILSDVRSQMAPAYEGCTIAFRLKSPASIRGKLLKKHLPATAACAHAALQDIAGLRVVLSSTQDVYRFADLLRSSPALELLEEHDYIALPKKSGYQSLHLIIRIPVYMDNQLHMVPAEIQLRTAPMDMWASIEHALIYKPVSF